MNIDNIVDNLRKDINFMDNLLNVYSSDMDNLKNDF
jgi:hypothetical protein